MGGYEGRRLGKRFGGNEGRRSKKRTTTKEEEV